MGAKGHVQRSLPLAAALIEHGAETWVFTERRYEDLFGALGAHFGDLYAGRSIELADDESSPHACRYVSFAGYYADSYVKEVAAIGPSLMVSDSFAVIGRVAASVLGLPHVDLCSGHDNDPTRFIERMEPDRVAVSDRCHRAVEILGERFGVEHASPFLYGTEKSSLLNLYGEPQLFISEETRAALEPVAFFGSLPPAEEIARRSTRRSPCWFGDGDPEARLYVSFGTIIWRYYTERALAALEVIAEVVGRDGAMAAIVSLGDAPVDEQRARALTRPNVTVHRYVDQWQVLAEADVFVTHHGLNSTHEAIISGVPMVSHPFFADQLPMAARCAELAIAVPLMVDGASAIDGPMVEDALRTCRSHAGDLHSALEEVRQADLEVIGRRGEVVERLLALA